MDINKLYEIFDLFSKKMKIFKKSIDRYILQW